ncbi:unnamed protein product [Adineta ricciae]|uniref:Uncharacterized protein n=1 Tax=Adineta ricciae TaxID=249248 RepID=A0A814V5B6_ADIRI|nr:unnamed protein product [Adineta ricciae]
MMANDMNSTFANEESLAYQQLPITFPVRFWIYLISNTLSLPCCFFILFHLLFNRNLRETLSNHIIIVILLLVLIMECTYFPLAIHYYRLGGNWHVQRPFSQLWTYSLFGFFPTQTVVFAWCTIQRHILIFHSQLLATKANRILVHYIPSSNLSICRYSIDGNWCVSALFFPQFNSLKDRYHRSSDHSNSNYNHFNSCPFLSFPKAASSPETIDAMEETKKADHSSSINRHSFWHFSISMGSFRVMVFVWFTIKFIRRSSKLHAVL